MKLTEDIKYYIDKSVLCWLATSDKSGHPNVSPKEAFSFLDDDIIIANIASPQSVANIKSNAKICISFIDIFVQKGYQIHGLAKIINDDDQQYSNASQKLQHIINSCDYPFQSITVIEVQKAKPILAPSYLFNPNTTEQNQIDDAKKTYGLE